MATTLAELIAEVEDLLYARTAVKDKLSYLTQALSATGTTLDVADATVCGRGFVEITSSAGLELIQVEKNDTTAATLTAFPWGRGQRGTSAVAHPQYSRVAGDPVFPRYRVVQALNETINAVYPDIFAVGVDTSITCDGITLQYPIDPRAETVLRVELRDIYAVGQPWCEVHKFDPNVAQSFVSLPRQVYGAPARVTFMCQASGFGTDLSQTLVSTGLSESAREALVLGAAYRMVNAVGLGRTALGSFAAIRDQESKGLIDSPNNIVKSLFQQYSLQVAAEAGRLRKKYPITFRYRR